MSKVEKKTSTENKTSMEKKISIENNSSKEKNVLKDINSLIKKHILWIISILSFIGICFSYRYLPSKIPTHWNASWEIDKLSDKKYIFVIGLFPILSIVLFDILPKIDPKRENYKRQGKVYQIMTATIVFLMIILDWITVAAALQLNLRIEEILPISMGIIFVVMGNYMPLLKSNFFVGIKNPWTLTNDDVWRKTHKVGGYVFVISGILMIIMAFIQNTSFNMIGISVLIIGLLLVNVYSYILFRKTQESNKN